jgi:hypothetical protein
MSLGVDFVDVDIVLFAPKMLENISVNEVCLAC